MIKNIKVFILPDNQLSYFLEKIMQARFSINILLLGQIFIIKKVEK